MNRKEFLTRVGGVCACSCVSALATALDSANIREAQEKPENQPETKPSKRPRSEVRIDFAERWVVRFLDVLDENLDAATRKKIMAANGRACLLSWQKATKQTPRSEAMTLESFAKQVRAKGTSDYQIQGNTIYFQYSSSAETGSPSPQGHCLCPMVETVPAGLSPTFCLCSLGYVQEMHEQIFERPVEVELLSSVLHGDSRCRFKITVA